MFAPALSTPNQGRFLRCMPPRQRRRRRQASSTALGPIKWATNGCPVPSKVTPRPMATEQPQGWGGSNPAVPLPGARVRDHRTCHDPLLKGKEHQFIKVGTGQRAPFQLDQINILWLSKIRYVADQRNQIGYCFREDSKAHRHLAPCLISSFCSIINLYSNFAGYHF